MKLFLNLLVNVRHFAKIYFENAAKFTIFYAASRTISLLYVIDSFIFWDRLLVYFWFIYSYSFVTFIRYPSYLSLPTSTLHSYSHYPNFQCSDCYSYPSYVSFALLVHLLPSQCFAFHQSVLPGFHSPKDMRILRNICFRRYNEFNCASRREPSSLSISISFFVRYLMYSLPRGRFSPRSQRENHLTRFKCLGWDFPAHFPQSKFPYFICKFYWEFYAKTYARMT